MPEIIIAQSAGFCFGVKRAVDKVYETIAKEESGKKLYTYGPIIHNDFVVSDIENKGVKIIDSLEELEKLKDAIVIIRSHGVPKNIYDLMENNHIEYIDMTCPFVKRIHNIVYKESEANNIVIFGSANHPEVVGIKGWCRNDVAIIESLEDAVNYKLSNNRPICIVSQTTFNYNKFQHFVEIFEKKGYDINVVNTICDATKNRQSEAKEIASMVDCMIVIGDKKSSNSRKLYEICSQECNNSYFIQDINELQISCFDKMSSVGITAGASTPNKLIEEVQNYVRVNF